MVLDGKQFFPHEIEPILAAAHTLTLNRYFATEDDRWRRAHTAVATVKVKVNKLLDESEYGEPPYIRKGSPLWSEIDSALVPVAADVRADVARLPIDTAPLSGGPDWVRPAAIGGALLGLFYIGYRWARR